MKPRFLFRLTTFSLAFGLCLLNATFLQGQDNSPPEQAFFKLDVNIEKLLENELIKSFYDDASDDLFELTMFGPGISGKDIRHVRVCAAPSLLETILLTIEKEKAVDNQARKEGLLDKKENAEEAEAARKEYLRRRDEIKKEIRKRDVNIYYQIVFASSKAAQVYLDGPNVMPNMKKESVNDMTVFRNPDEGWGVIYYDNNRTVTLSTTDFLNGKDGIAGTKFIEDHFAAFPDHSIRVAIDLKPIRPLIKKLKELNEVPIVVFGIIDAIESAAIAIDPRKDQLANLLVNTDSQSNAELIASQINGQLRSARNKLNRAFSLSAKNGSKEAANVIEFAKSWTCVVKDASARMNVSKPAGYDTFVKSAFDQARAAAEQVRKINNFRQVVLAAHNYESAHQEFPFGKSSNNKINKDLSWRAILLPYLYATNIEGEVHYDQAWDSEHNRQFIKQMPDVYGDDKTSGNPTFVGSRLPTNR